MALELLLGCRLQPCEKMTVIKLTDLTSSEKVQHLRNKTAEHTKLSNDAFDLIYCGCHLENNATLESYGLKNGSMVHVLKRKDIKMAHPSSVNNGSETNVDMLTSIFKSFVGNPLLELALRRLTKRPEVIENIISSSPGLSQDAVAVAILQDPDLIVHFTNTETINKIAKLHPALLEAAQHIASAVHDEAHNFAVSSSSINSSPLANAQTTGHSYSLENLSDDEEMAGDSSQSSDSVQAANNSSQSRNQSLISAAQLFSAISRAQRTVPSGNSSASTSSPPTSQTSSNNTGVITFEMFNQAMQQAFAANTTGSDQGNSAQSPVSPVSFAAPDNPSSTNDMQRQITIMHEMGLRNDAINLQALQVTNGNVQAAIELVLSGFGEM